MTCSKVRKLCQDCDSGLCNDESKECVDKASTTEGKKKCMRGWMKCTKCFCTFKECKAHAPVPEKCKIGLILCRRCETEKCDTKKVECLKTAKAPEDVQKCVGGWFQCVLGSCRPR